MLVSLPHRLFGLLALRDVDRCPDVFDEHTRLVEDRVGQIVNVPDRTVRANDPILSLVIDPVVRRLVESIHYAVPILRMEQHQECFVSWCRRPGLESEDAKKFL